MELNKSIISIILPVYNGAHTLKWCIESVLAQTHQEWELIVVDDGSTDNTKSIVAQYVAHDSRIIYIKNEHNLGIQKTLNRGLKEVKGKYIARIDADDVWSDPDKLSTQVSFLEANTEYVLVGTGARLVSTEHTELNHYLLPQDDVVIRARMLAKNCFVHSSVLMRSVIVQDVGGYSESVISRHVEDHELWLRLGEKGKLKNLPLYGVDLMVSDTSITAKYRVLQAKRMLKLGWQYRKKYPNAFLGIVIGIIRLVFFAVVSMMPLSKKGIYFIQSIVRRS